MARQRQERAEFKQQYAARAGVEGTLSQGADTLGMRHAWYVDLARAHLQNILTVAAMNITRAVAWLNDVPRAKTRTSQLAVPSP